MGAYNLTDIAGFDPHPIADGLHSHGHQEDHGFFDTCAVPHTDFGDGNISPARPSLRQLNKYPALVLNADYRPLSYFPLSIWHWQDAIKAVVGGRVQVVSEYEVSVRAQRTSIQLPSVISLKDYVKQDRSPAFTRFNVFLRDGFACQYCGASHDLTFDHVVPRNLGGGTNWTNITTACAPCNFKKGGRPLAQSGLHLRTPPRVPSLHHLQAMGRKFPPNHLHESWMDWLYWDVELHLE